VCEEGVVSDRRRRTLYTVLLVVIVVWLVFAAIILGLTLAF
jgi:hypothetical protein